MTINVSRLVAAIRFVPPGASSRLGGDSGRYVHDGITEVRYDYGDNRPIIMTHHPNRGEAFGKTGIMTGDWTMDCPSPFRPDSERTLCHLPMAA